ncbi:MAG: hypothetical protein ABI685_06235 [Ferruginibacter sp.]
MKTLISIIIFLTLVSVQAFSQSKASIYGSLSGFKYLRLEYNNHFGATYSLTIDSTGKIIYRPSPEITMSKRIVTRITGNFTRKEFDEFVKKLTSSLILSLEERKEECGIDGATKDFKLSIGNKDIHSKGCSLNSELKLFFEYLDKLHNNKGFINKRKG